MDGGRKTAEAERQDAEAAGWAIDVIRYAIYGFFTVVEGAWLRG